MAKHKNSAPAVQPRAEVRPRLLSIVCPAYDEEDGLCAFAMAIEAAMLVLAQPYEIVFVNDGSRDGTLSLMRRLREKDDRIAIVDLSRNFGKEIATTAGLDHAKGDAAVVMDADLQDPPEVIADMLKGWREGYDVVYARRRERRGDGAIKRLTASLFYKVIHRIEHGEGRPEDLALLDDVAGNIMGRTICALGDAAALPVRSFVKHFRDEFAYHIENKQCLVPPDGQKAGSTFHTRLMAGATC
jgi:glycosyltransferase involved in cell wall biosynthesis